jgi:hypothetical protein
MKMLGKDRNYFKKNQARKNKNDEAAASNMADAEAGSDLEDDADDDDDEPEQTAPEPTKAVATKKRAPKKHATNLKKLAAPTPALPTIQNGCLNGTVIVKKETALGSRRPHRKKNWHYESAPSESEWEQKKHDKSDPYKNENIAKLRETVNRHARWCPFVQINKRLHHAHRRIRFLEGLPIPESLESSDCEDDNPGNHNGKGSAIEVGNGNGNDPVQKEYNNGNGEIEDDTQQPEVIDEDTSTALPGKKAKAKVTSANETALTTKVPTKPAHEQSPVDPNHEDSSLSEPPLSEQGSQIDHPLSNEERDDEAEAEIQENSAANNRDSENGAGDATAGAPNQSVSISKITISEDDASNKSSPISEDELEAQNEAYLKRQRADAAKKRKISEIELTSDAEHVSKSRKIRAV